MRTKGIVSSIIVSATFMIMGCGVGQLLGPLSTPTASSTPTATPTSTATPTPAFTPTATLTATLAEAEMNESVKQGDWEIKVLSAVNEETDMDTSMQEISTSKPNTYILNVKIVLNHLTGEPIKGNHLFTYGSSGNIADYRRVIVRDNAGKGYLFFAVGDSYYDQLSQVKDNGFMSWDVSNAELSYLFIVPNDVNIADFMWGDFPPIKLTIEAHE